MSETARTNLVQMLRQVAQDRPDHTAFVYLPDGEQVAESVTFGELDRRARALAARLRERELAGERAVLSGAPGIDFVVALAGCFYAGVTAVPVVPESSGYQRRRQRMAQIVADCAPAIELTSDDPGEPDPEPGPGDGPGWLPRLSIGSVGTDGADGFVPARVTGDTLAILQYTSGSTANPRGVMVSHRNVLSNVEMLAGLFEQPADATTVNWLPLHHDMGLFGNVLRSLYSGVRCVLMPPNAFLRRPLRWLRAVSDYRAWTSGAPNFAYDMCVRRITPAERDTLDLSCWEVAFNGSEPVRVETLERFAETFGPAGFRRRAFLPGYGLAEATLMVSGVARTREPAVHALTADGLRRGEVVPADAATVEVNRQVSCGAPGPSVEVAVVDPGTRRRLPADRVGELWLRGPGVAAGYWGRPEESAEVFGVALADEPATRTRSRRGAGSAGWLRTGDLGALVDGELVVTGRIKDLIIVRGANHYPQDIEHTVRETIEANRAGNTAVFAETGERAERLVVVQEVRAAGLDLAAVCDGIHKRVSVEHGLTVDRIVLVRPGQVPRTSSGKVQRARCRALLAEGALTVVYDDDRAAAPEGPGVAGTEPGATGHAAPAMDESFVDELRDLVAGLVNRPVAAISADAPLTAARIDSLYAAELQELLHQRYGVEVELTELFGSPSLRALAGQVYRRGPGSGTAPGGSDARRADAGPPVAAPDVDLGGPADPFPLTPLQEAYIAGRTPGFELGGVGTHVYLEYTHDDLDVGRAVEAWRTTVRRHDMLRAVVTPDGRQRVRPELPDPIHLDDLRDAPDAERRVTATRERMSHQVLDPYTGPLFEIRISLLPGGATVVHISVDLLILDASGVLSVLREWGRHYASGSDPGPVAGPSFRDFLLRRRAHHDRHAERIAAQLREQGARLHPGPGLPLAVDPATVGRPAFRRRRTRLDPAVWQRLEQAALSRGVTRAALLGAAFSEVLALYSEQRPFTLTVTSFDRPIGQVGPEVVGEFTSLLLVPVGVGGDFDTRLRDFSHGLAAALQHREIEGVALLRERMRGADPGRPPRPLAPVVFTCLLQDVGDLGWLGEQRYAISQTPQVWLDHQVVTSGGTPELVWDAVEALFPAGLLDDMFDTYQRLLHNLAGRDSWQAPGRDLAGLARLTVAAGTPVLAGSDRLLDELVLAQVRRTPDAVAVVVGGRRITYRQLGTASALLAARLVDAGLRPGDLVAVATRRDWTQVAAVLGVLRAGGVYVPVDAASAPQRLRQLLADSTARYVLGCGAAGDWAREVRYLAVDDLDTVDLDRPVPEPPPSGRTPDDLAYLIYTSGSTGQPKGVAISHHSAANTVLDINDRFAVGPGDRILGVTPLTFDLSVYDIFGLLAAGGTLVLPEHERRGDPEHWAELLDREAVTCWNSVPPLLRLLVETPTAAGRDWARQLRLLMLSGDWIGVDFAATLRRELPAARLVSLGGATEGAIWSVAYEVDRVDPAWRSVPYGRALRGQGAVVLGDDLQPRPVWAPGPLYLTGAGLAREYWRDADRTAASFPVHPDTGIRLYRTGDVARLLPDGNLELLGREDHQIKVRGHRIEPGEVEAALATHPGVRDSVVGATGPRDGERRLVAYVRPVTPGGIDPGQLREYLAGLLPRYLVPDAIRIVTDIPLTGNGKIDRSALFGPAVVVPGVDTPPTVADGDPGAGRQPTGDAPDGTAPDGTAPDAVDPLVSQAVLRIVESVAGAPGVDPQASFIELEFTSVHQIRLANALEAEFGTRPRLDDLYQMRTVADLIRHFSRLTPTAGGGAPGTGGADRAADPAAALATGTAPAGPAGGPAAAAGPAVPDSQGPAPAVGLTGAAYPVTGLIADPAERAAFKQRHRSRPAPAGTGIRITLPDEPADPELFRRRTAWSFSPEPIGAAELAGWLGCLRERSVDGRPRHAWGSAGGIYPIDVYLQVHGSRVRGLAAGFYHYDPRSHSLTLLAEEPLIRSAQHAADNRRLHDESAVAVFLVADLAAITPLYGELAERFCLIESGAMSQLLETRAAGAALLTCPIGVVDFTPAVTGLGLGAGQRLAYTLLAGRPPTNEPPTAPGTGTATRPAPVPVPAATTAPPAAATPAVLPGVSAPPVPTGPGTPPGGPTSVLLAAASGRGPGGYPDDADPADLTTPYRAVTPSRLVGAATLRLPTRLPARTPADGARSVLVTGATGFLGAHLIADLLARPGTTVYGLARATDEAAAGRRLHQALRGYGLSVPPGAEQRLVGIPGDLAAFRLGMPADRYGHLLTEIDVVYHSGAAVNWAHSYRQLAPANVAGTRRVIEFAVTGRHKRVVHVSTVAVFPFGGDRPVTEDADLDHDGPLYGGYPQSKWVAERIVTQAAAAGVDVLVVRPGTVTGHSVTGSFNPSSFLDLFLVSCIRTGWAPELVMPLDMTPVDYVSAATVALADRPGGGAGRTYHLTNPAPLPLAQVYDLIGAAGYPLRREPFDAWRERLLDPAVIGAAGLAPFTGYLRHAEAAYLRMPPYDSTRAVADLAGTQVGCAPVSQRLVSTYLAAYARTAGLLDRSAATGVGPA